MFSKSNFINSEINFLILLWERRNGMRAKMKRWERLFYTLKIGQI